MGNLTSQIGNSSNKYKLGPPSEPAQLSLPRVNQQQQQQQKVLPVSNEPPPKLKPTENGRILLAGGTLTGRHLEKISRGNFMNAKEKVKFLREIQEDRTQRVHRQKELTKKFGSEPDLRHHLRAERTNLKPKRYVGSKTPNQGNISSEYQQRIGLFRTREETRKTHQLALKSSPAEKVNENNRLSSQHKGQRDVRDDVLLLRNHRDVLNLESSINVDAQETDKKKYYFGMENDTTDNLDYLNYEIEDYEMTKLSDDMRSNLSNNVGGEDDDDSQTISLYLRPILPKKQLEMPKFSSSLAWKLLYSTDSSSNVDGSTTNNEEEFPEEGIEKALPILPQRLLPNKSLDFQFSQDKSGDSGISGDETPKPTLSHYKSKQSWTPQQDLGDDSSTDDEMRFYSVPYSSNTNKPHVFSLSLPRDHVEWSSKTQTCLHSGNSINRLQRSVSGVFGNCGVPHNDATSDAMFMTKNFNWLLSKSAPNSLNNGFNSLESAAYVYNEELTSLVPLNAKGRIIYLPEGDVGVDVSPDQKRTAKNSFVCRNASDDDGKGSCENVIREVAKREQDRLREIETMQRIEEEFRRKRARYNNLYSNSRQHFRKVLLSPGEKSV